MDSDEVEAEVRKIIQRIGDIDVSKIGDDEPLSEHGFDELCVAETVLAIEESFDVNVPDAVADRLGAESTLKNWIIETSLLVVKR